ncbi:transketolase C-terminal domain-containing protein [Streptomyces sp. NPDC007991]|uniref:transketolase-like TK C-terminal-containing protein n=1 Tax=Streptomyces sp. NPDC007991 TaxID=3364803 RepID=UPI0036E8CAB7
MDTQHSRTAAGRTVPAGRGGPDRGARDAAAVVAHARPGPTAGTDRPPVHAAGREARGALLPAVPAGAPPGRRERPAPPHAGDTGAPADGAARGGYVLAEADGGTPEVVLVATGREVPIALGAREILQREGTATRVVSMPSAEVFRTQGREYRDSVLPPGAGVRVSVSAGLALGWYAMLAAGGETVGLGQFAERGAYRALRQQPGFTPERVAAAARARLRGAR